MNITYKTKTKTYDASHGSPFDRGSADSHYSRPAEPHWYPQGTYNGDRIDEGNMSEDQVAAYMAGFWYNEQFGDKKNYE